MDQQLQQQEQQLQNQPIHYAGFWRRFAAYFIDISVLHILLLPVVFLFLRNSALWNFVELSRKLPPTLNAMFREGDPMAYALIMKNIFIEISIYIFFQALVILLYYSFWESSSHQATPGKMAVRIKVETLSGERISFFRALARNASKLLSGALFMIGYILAGLTPKKQALHDLITECIIVHPEPRVEPGLHHPHAGFWRRFVAWVLDMILISIVISPIKYILMPASYSNYFNKVMKALESGDQVPLLPMNDILLISILSTVSALITWFYFASWESSKHQATPGKLAIGLKVIDVTGQKLSFWRASGRYAGKLVSNLTCLIGYMIAGWTTHKQALHDKLSDCLVIVSR